MRKIFLLGAVTITLWIALANMAIATVPPANQQLIDSLTQLNQTIQTKVDNDVDLMAEIFKETKSYQKSAGWVE